MKRNTKKEKKKRNKGFPYKKTRKMKDNLSKIFKRNCRICEKRFRPVGKSQQLCYDCSDQARQKIMLSKLKAKGVTLEEYEE